MKLGRKSKFYILFFFKSDRGSRFQKCPLKGSKGAVRAMDGLERVKIPEMHLSEGNKGALRAMGKKRVKIPEMHLSVGAW
jgi:hypothetical protein